MAVRQSKNLERCRLPPFERTTMVSITDGDHRRDFYPGSEITPPEFGDNPTFLVYEPFPELQ
jgi:hypothetical protein